LMNGCEACCALIWNFVKAKASFGKPLHVSLINAEKDVHNPNGKHGRDGDKGKGRAVKPEDVKDHFCEKEEHSRFTEAAKKKLRDMRAARGHVSSHKRQKVTDDRRSQIASVAAEVVDHVDANDGSGGGGWGEETAVVGNRTNQALTRQRR